MDCQCRDAPREVDLVHRSHLNFPSHQLRKDTAQSLVYSRRLPPHLIPLTSLRMHGIVYQFLQQNYTIVVKQR